MEELLFKNIPAEGFDPDCGFTDRISNPTPSRSNSKSAMDHEQCSPVDDRLSNVQTHDRSVIGYSDITDRLSNVAPSRRNMSAGSVAKSVESPCNDSERMSSVNNTARASNPTPSRRAAVSSSPCNSPYADDYYRASNPTPTRRLQNAFSEPPVMFPGTAAETEDVLTRASNPTPTRRSKENEYDSSSYHRTKDSFSVLDSDTGGYMSFERDDNPYGVGKQSGIGDSRASNPTPTRRTAQVIPVQEDYDNESDRLSNYSPSQHK